MSDGLWKSLTMIVMECSKIFLKYFCFQTSQFHQKYSFLIKPCWLVPTLYSRVLHATTRNHALSRVRRQWGTLLYNNTQGSDNITYYISNQAWLWCSSVLLKTNNKNWAWLLKKATLACCSMRRSAELSFRFCDYFFHSKLHNSKTTHMPPQFKSGYDLVLVEMTGNILVWTFQNVRHKQQIFMLENFIFEFIENRQTF